ncbi:uncharacterized protein LOC128683624 isoform X2 [Plodia interpunctella]|uniref:uncharacterized protein LOC128683624 isoform X2 n=1 Tax=Plodia interpunctella TaxID=58824 RepID=UPI0023681AA9|nr:uncharacterized protein LOC128683624 isoform X2 [Plodia interpunctella]
MRKSASSENVNATDITVSNARNNYKRISPDTSIILPKRRYGHLGRIFEHYCITIKPKLYRSNSLTNLTTISSDFNLDFFKRTQKFVSKRYMKESICGSFGDTEYCGNISNFTYMSSKFKGKNKKKEEMSPETYGSKFASEYINNQSERDTTTEANFSSGVDNSSSQGSLDRISTQKAAFPFKSTPSGNFKVQSNQVVFQSSTVGVLLADPTQAKVKVKFEGQPAGEPDDALQTETENDTDEPQLQYDSRDIPNYQAKIFDRNPKTKLPDRESKDNKMVMSKDLNSLGYANAEPVDWTRVQLPKKQDLFQEFYRRIHTHVNTDTIVHIGEDGFHCHRIVLQIYSTFFQRNSHREIELPTSQVTSEAFQTIYEWMIFSGPDSNKVLRRDNVLDVFSAAQFLSIKDLEDQCWAFIVSEDLFIEDTAFTLYREARIKGMTPVTELMIPRVMRFFLPLVSSKDFVELELQEILPFFKSNYICVTSEIEVLMAGVRWLNADWPERQQYTVEVMRCVRFGLISPWQLVDIKRNPDNEEILEIVNEPEVQQMVDDGLAYVIIKYWYGNNSKNYYHWIDVLGLTEPAERNWIGEEKNHVTYKDFLKYLEQFMIPKDQLYQQMTLMQPPRRSDDVPGSIRGLDIDKLEMRRRTFEFPLSTLKSLGADKDKFPTMSDFFENRRKEGVVSPRSPSQEVELPPVPHIERRPSPDRERQLRQIEVDRSPTRRPEQILDFPEKDSTDTTRTSPSETSGDSVDTSLTDKNRYAFNSGERRHSVAASYLATATAALAGPKKMGHMTPTSSPPPLRPPTGSNVRPDHVTRSPPPVSQNNNRSPQISLFNQSKESLARQNLNKLSMSVLGPNNKNYMNDGSLFNWDRETVLVFGGIDPHTTYGSGRNTGKNIYRFDPVTNVWDYVGDLPEPRHHHSVAFLRGRVYLVGGADPRDDDIRGKSVVVSTVWSFEPVSKSWYSESGLSIPRKNFGLVVHRMSLYAIGGQDKKGRVLRSVERFDPKTGFWTEVRSMSVARMAVAAVKYRDYIWVAGGMTGEKKKPVCKIVECYNSKTNEWTEIHSLRFPRCLTTLFVMNDKLYIIGGAGKKSEKDKTASSVSAIDTWDWKTREWKAETEMSMPRHGHALAYLGTQLIIIGGMTTVYMRALNHVESYCCERGAWIRGVATLPSPLSGHGAVTLPPASLM